ncbi:ATP-binding cassette domain-containing protein [Aquibacillus halophilus]|uniref:Carnitine transport ATP-binding protein OpuCA n=1 Tax=Aquibacillus halophilus TaxID=930132 RepID=A0A6A8D9C2_9BACI|nr:ATP-binding cassette domain-containing protein [Aquibacillus halophilus]MRH41136.1 ATP-binding cassette domain-containing protein [Aquibacillus halophilus]
MSYVKIEGVSKYFGSTKVLNNISLSIEEGEFITLLGPSGCGKSTLLRAIAGLNDLSSGDIYVGDKKITHLPSKDREVGMVFQSYALFPNLNVFQNIAFGLKMEKMDKEQYTVKVEEMVELIDLKGKENMYPGQLSGGQQQRVALARALIKKPKILLLDEPLSALDAQIRRTLRNEIRLIQRKLNMTTIFVTHDQEEALTISDRIFVMNHGDIEQEGGPRSIYTSPETEFVARFIGNYNVLKKSELETTGARLVSENELFAIRPEAISIFPLAKEGHNMDETINIICEAEVVMSTVLGNVMRFDMDVKGIGITVDALNESKIHWIKNGMTVQIAIPIEECKGLRIPS